MSERAGRYQRTFSGLIGSMLVLLLVVLAFVAFRAVNRSDVENPVRAVEYVDDLPYFRSQAGFPLLAPATLPQGWKATSVRFEEAEPQSWHLGLLTDEGEYVGIEQSEDTVPSMVDRYVDVEAEEGSPVTVDGVAWETYTDAGGDTALVRRADDVTTLVVGTLTEDELADFVATLQ